VCVPVSVCSIKEAVTLINAIDVNKFSRLISRIIQKLHLKGERTFSEEEEEKLQAALSLDKNALNLVLETSAFILEQAVYHNVKPASLQQQLEMVHLTLEKAEVFSQTWATAGPELVEKQKLNVCLVAAQWMNDHIHKSASLIASLI
uniref:COMM domain containing 10 n=1 Tax=Amphilophus citrinellus TaxID=61819 RepID=A0A3Q0R3V3_AMPCI